MRDIANKITGSTLTADEWNDVPSEIENAVTDSGQVLATLPIPPDLSQLSKAMSNYAAAGTLYTDASGTNTKVFSIIGARQAPNAYYNGMIVRCYILIANTGAVTINPGGLGAKSVRKNDAADALVAGDLPIGYAEFVFDEALDRFNLATIRQATETVRGVAELATSAEAIAGVNAVNVITPATLAAVIGGGIFPSGTRMAFHQAAAPAGWTQDVTLNDRMLRVVSGAGGGNGGSWTISGLTVGDTFLTVAQLPVHFHSNGIGVTIPELTPHGSVATGGLSSSGTQFYPNGKIGNTSSVGSAATHTHTLSSGGAWRPLYTNLIICQKD